MTLFLYGADSYRSREKLQAIRRRFLSHPGAEANYLRLFAPDFDLDTYLEAVVSTPFLSRSRLVVVEGLLSYKNLADQVTARLEETPPSTVVVFYESSIPDGRLTSFQKLKKSA